MTKSSLLLLHGALGAQDQFKYLAPLLEDQFAIHRLDFEGHGTRPSDHDTFHNDYFVDNVQQYLEENGLTGVQIFGFSLGGYVACTLASRAPELVSGIITLGTKFHWDEATYRRETKYLDVDNIKTKVPKFADILAKRHTAEGWENVVNRTQDLLRSNAKAGGITPEFMAGLTQPVRVIIGDRDHTVPLEEAGTIYQALQQGQLEILPNTPHPFEKASMERLAVSIRDFFK